MELRGFYEFDSWPPDSGWDRREAVQLVARQVGDLVAVRRSVADVDWILQVQNVISAANVRSTTQAESAMTIGRGSVVSGEGQQIDSAMAAVGNGNGSGTACVLSTVLSMDHRVRRAVHVSVACGVGSSGATTVAAADQATEEAAAER